MKIGSITPATPITTGFIHPRGRRSKGISSGFPKIRSFFWPTRFTLAAEPAGPAVSSSIEPPSRSTGRRCLSPIVSLGKSTPSARGKVLARIVPLSLPEWRSDRRAGDFSLTGEGLVLTAAGRNRLFAAILIDFEPTRVGRRVKMTWRRLTVGENSEKADDAVAVGFRYHAGGDQYLIYRSLEQAAPRSVLGEHILDGFVVSRFTPNEEADYVFRQP